MRRRISEPLVTHMNQTILERQAFTVSQFCEAHGFSRAMFYALLKDGTGPTTMLVRGRRLISRESASAWRAAMTAATAKQAA